MALKFKYDFGLSGIGSLISMKLHSVKAWLCKFGMPFYKKLCFTTFSHDVMYKCVYIKYRQCYSFFNKNLKQSGIHT